MLPNYRLLGRSNIGDWHYEVTVLMSSLNQVTLFLSLPM